MNAAQTLPETPTPHVGMGATLTVGSDRYPYTVITVSPSGRRITIQRDDHRRRDKNGAYTESQTYLYVPNSEGETMQVSLRRDGYWRPKGRSCRGYWLRLGTRSCHLDPCF